MAQADALVREHDIQTDREKFCNDVAAFTASVHQFTSNLKALDVAEIDSTAAFEEQVNANWTRIANTD